MSASQKAAWSNRRLPQPRYPKRPFLTIWEECLWALRMKECQFLAVAQTVAASNGGDDGLFDDCIGVAVQDAAKVRLAGDALVQVIVTVREIQREVA